MQFRDVPTMESVYPNSTKQHHEVVHEATGEVLKVRPAASPMQQHTLPTATIHFVHMPACQYADHTSSNLLRCFLAVEVGNPTS